MPYLRLWATLCLCGYFSFLLPAQNPSSLIAEEYQDALALRLHLISEANPLDQDWLQLELENMGLSGARLVSANAQLELKAYAKGQSGAVLKANLQVNTPEALFPNTTTPLAEHTKNYASLAELTAAKLGFPEATPWQVKAWLSVELRVQKSKTESIHFEWPELEFSFVWQAPSAVALHRGEGQLVDLLHHPSPEKATANRLHILLHNPQLKRANSPEYLLKALQLRPGNTPERSTLVAYLNQYYADSEVVLQHYRRLLHQKDFTALIDLQIANNIWSTQYLEPLIIWFQEGNSAALMQIMSTLYVHRAQWVERPGIATIFSDLLLFRYEEIIHKNHVELSDRELLNWCSAAKLLGQTGNPELQSVFCSYLSCRSTWSEQKVYFPSATPSLYPPASVADVALEALLQLEVDDLDSYYREAGYKPTGDIDHDRDQLQVIRQQLRQLQEYRCLNQVHDTRP